MEVIVDTNVLMDAIFDQFNCEDCWEILHLIRKKDITPVLCEDLLREYMFVPSKIAINSLTKLNKEKRFIDKNILNLISNLYNCYYDICRIISRNSKIITVKSKEKFCDEDPDDDKIINLAIDANCNNIITKNIEHFKCIYTKNIKTYTGKQIEIYKPNEFLKLLTKK